jgi:hypothetical protein
MIIPLFGKYMSNLILPKKYPAHLEQGCISNLFGNRGRGALSLLLSILMLLCIIGCIQNDKYIGTYSEPENAFNESGSHDHKIQKDCISRDPNLRLELDFQSEVGQKLFHTWGSLMLWSETSLPYLVLNATLCNGDLKVNMAKYMLIKVDPAKKYSFDISKNLRIPPGDYVCILEASGPFGSLTSEKRDCQAIEESADTNLQNANNVAEIKAEDDALGQFTKKASEEKGDDQDKHANDYSFQETNSKTSSADLASETKRDAEKSDGSVSADDSEAGSETGRIESLHQDLSSTQALNGSSISANIADGDGQATATESSSEIGGQDIRGAFVGSAGSNIYHRLDCRFVSKIKKKIYYKSAEDARSNGKVPCKICNPP